ncbi:MAG: hypothetical protein ACR2OV_07060, partial [Hyphomicrobiaceae bacterium]
MSKLQTHAFIGTGLIAFAVAGFAHPATAQQDIMKQCGEKWQELKKKNNGAAPKGMTWNKYLSDCRKRITATKTKSTTKTAAPRAKAARTKARATSPQDVMKVCGAAWQKVKDKNNGKAPKGMTWKKFLSDCRKRQAGGRTVAKAAAAKPKKRTAKTKASGESMMSACGGEWRKLKEKNKVPKGMTWTRYLGECSKRYADKFEPTPKQLAMYSRIRKCGAMWREA